MNDVWSWHSKIDLLGSPALGYSRRKMSGSTNPLYGVNIYKYNDGTPTVYRQKTVNGTDNTVRYFREMQYYWPIPWDEIRRHGIPQNPSWLEM